MTDHTAYPMHDRLIFWSMLGVLIWLPIPWASHIAWAQSLFVFLVSLMLSIWLFISLCRPAQYSKQVHRLIGPILLWGLWIGWVAVQIITLDTDFLARISPSAFALRQPLIDVGLTPANTVSINKAATIDGLLLSVGYCGLYWLVVLTCWKQPNRIRLVLGALVVSGTLQALYGSFMTLSGMEYGFVGKKVHYLGDATGTFINRNHLAGYLELASAAGIGLILADLKPHYGERSWKRWLDDLIALSFSNKFRTRIVLAIMAVAIVLTRSRMGNAAFFISLCVCGLGYIFLRERRLALKATLFFASLLLIDVMIVSNWFGLSRVVDRIEKTEVATETRARLYDELPPVVAAYAKTGSGLGTFAQAYAPYRSAEMRTYMDHAHNDYLEFIVEVGLPGFIILLIFVGAHAVHALHVILRRRSRLPAAVCFSTLMATVAYAIHATVEFNLQIPANAATFVVLLALCACCSEKSRVRGPRMPVEKGRAVSDGQRLAV